MKVPQIPGAVVLKWNRGLRGLELTVQTRSEVLELLVLRNNVVVFNTPHAGRFTAKVHRAREFEIEKFPNKGREPEPL